MFKTFLKFLLEDVPTWDVQPLKGWNKGLKSIRSQNVIMKRLAEFESIIRTHPQEREPGHEDILTNKFNHHPTPYPSTVRGRATMAGLSDKLQKEAPGADYKMMQSHIDSGGGTVALTAHRIRGKGPDIYLVGIGSHNDFTGG